MENFFKRALKQGQPQTSARAVESAASMATEVVIAGAAAPAANSQVPLDVYDEIQRRKGSSEAVLVERRARLGEGWRAIPLPAEAGATWRTQAVMLERRVEQGHQLLMLIRQDRYSTSAGAVFRNQIKAKFKACVFCQATAVVIAELLQAPTREARNEATPRTKVSNALQRGFEWIEHAIAVDASDIHVEIYKEGRFAPRYRLRMRVNGKLRNFEVGKDQQAVEAVESVVIAMYQDPTVAPDAEKSSSTFVPNARCYASLKPPVKGAELRFESNPTVAGYKVVMRLLSYEGKRASGRDLESLGFSDHMSTLLLRACQAPSGLVLVVGATGAGKTSTIATALEADPTADEKVRIGMEIPPEIAISELEQYRVDLETLREVAVGVARSDPDVIYAGEINSHETALMAQDYALTGHLTLATFHANSAAAALMRLIGDAIRMDPAILGMERFLRAVLYQSLVPVLCQHCREPAEDALDAERLTVLQEKFGLDVSSMYVRHRHTGEGEPCRHCGGTGEVGRTAIAELIVPDRTFLNHVMERNINAAMDHYRSQRMTGFEDMDTRGKTFVEHALAKASQGLICADGIFNGVEDLFSYEVRPLMKMAEAVPLRARAGEPR